MLHRSIIASLIGILAAAFCAGSAQAICDVIPQVQDTYRGALGSVDRPFASRRDVVEISLDTAGCDAASPGFEVSTAQLGSPFPFAVDAEGWSLEDDTAGPIPFSFVATGGNPDGFIEGVDSATDAAYFVGPPSFGGDWSGFLGGTTVLSFDLKVSAGGGNLGVVQLVRLESGSCDATHSVDVSSLPADTWTHFEIPITTGAWSVPGFPCFQTLAQVLANVLAVEIRGDVRSGPGETMALDNVKLGDPQANILTVVYTPPNGGDPSARIYTEDPSTCTAPDFVAAMAACEAELGVPNEVFCNQAGQGVLSKSADRLAFDFPFAGRAGPVRIAVTGRNDPLPCELVSIACDDPAAPAGLRACIGSLYENDSTCETDATQTNATFPAFTALPVPNDFAANCTSLDPSSPCVGNEPDFEVATDIDGNLLVPMAWSRVLVPGAIPIPRIVGGTTSFPAFSGQPDPLSVPGSSFLASFSTRGHRVPPLFTPVAQTSNASAILGSVDAERGVMRIARRGARFGQCQAGDRDAEACNEDGDCPNGTCGPGTCQAGANVGDLCTSDAQCPGSECGPGLFELRDRLDAGFFAVKIPGAEYDADAQTPVAIDAIFETDTLVATSRSEPLEGPDVDSDGIPDGLDLNGDGDVLDTSVASLRAKATNSEVMIGSGGTTAGEPVVRAQVGSFTSLAAAAEDEFFVFLETEANGNGTPRNGDSDLLDYLVNGVRLPIAGPPEALIASVPADGAARIEGSPLQLSDGLLFWRQTEWDSAPQEALASPEFDWNSFSDDGRYALRVSNDPTLVPGGDSDSDVYVVDRDTDQDGVLDEVGATSIFQVSLLPNGNQPSGIAYSGGTISRDGRFVLYRQLSMVTTDRSVILYDRDADQDGIFDEPGETERVTLTVTENGVVVGSGSISISGIGTVSGDGRYAVFQSDISLVTGLDTGDPQAWIVDRDADEDGNYDDEGDGYDAGEIAVRTLGPGSREPEISEDGAWIVYNDYLASPIQALVVRNQTGAVPGLIAESEAGVPFGGGGIVASGRGQKIMSRDGRFVAAITGDAEVPSSAFVRDRDADEDGFLDDTVRNRFAVSQTAFGFTLWDLTGDGRFAFAGRGGADGGQEDFIVRFDTATNVAAELINRPVAPAFSDGFITQHGRELVFFGDTSQVLLRPDVSAPQVSLYDLNGDGDLDDTVLRVFDLRTAPSTMLGVPPPPPVTEVNLPAGEVALADGNAIFLASEAQAGVDYNGDLDLDDEVAHIWLNRQAGAPDNLAVAARKPDASTQFFTFLDADTDHVVFGPMAPSPGLTDLGIAASEVYVFDDRIAFITTTGMLNVYDATNGIYLVGPGGLPPMPAVDTVSGESAVAFRVPEAIAGDLNGDSDTDDDVMHVLDLAALQVLNTEFAAVPCPTEACDPERPYTVQDGKVRFLTLEIQQAGSPIGCSDPGPICDLDGDGLGTGLVLQNFNVVAAMAGMSCEDATQAVGLATAGICTDTGEPCASNTDCPVGVCFVPPGGCIRDLGTACTTSPPTCPGAQFCIPFGGGDILNGTCFQREGDCNSDEQCTAPAFCSNESLNAQRIVAAVEGSDGGELLLSVGKCLGAAGAVCSLDSDCGADERCEDGNCRVVDNTCRDTADCSEGFTCERLSIIAGSGDQDGDALADAIDNCDDVPNGDQLDLDQDGVGDACDRESCGNGIQEYTETCDHGDQNGIDGVCDIDCAYIGVGPACADGIDNDGDGVTDLADPGCDDALDTSERSALLACDDGRDNDGDYGSDVAGDAGCANPNSNREDPQCSDGLDNDGDGTVDWDGAGYADPDAFCGGLPAKVREKPPKKGCGLGGESLVLLPLAWWLGLRRKRPGREYSASGTYTCGARRA